MISHEKYDVDSARLMLSHLGKALKHYDERQHARQKLKIELSRLKKISTKSMKGYIDNLQHSIGDAIKKEQRILKHQQDEDIFHGDIKDRIRELEGRLAKYLTIHEARANRVKLLENALATEHNTKQEQIVLIKKSISRAESILKSAMKDKKHSRKDLAETKALLERIKARIKHVEKRI